MADDPRPTKRLIAIIVGALIGVALIGMYAAALNEAPSEETAGDEYSCPSNTECPEETVMAEEPETFWQTWITKTYVVPLAGFEMPMWGLHIFTALWLVGYGRKIFARAGPTMNPMG